MWYRRAKSEIHFRFQHYPNDSVSEVLAYFGDDVIGNMEFTHTQNGVITTNAHLDPECRGRGYGKQMYQFAWNNLKSIGETLIRSDKKVRTDARRVYESLMQSPDWNVERSDDDLSTYKINSQFPQNISE